MIGSLEEHLKHGAELAASHVPALVEWATKVQSDDLVQAAIGLVVPPATRTMLVGLLKSVETEVARVAEEAKAAAAAQAAADAAAAASPAPEPAPEPPPA